MAKYFEDLCFRDWFIFGRVMEDPDLCHDFLATLLQENIGNLTTIVREKELRIRVDGKTIRLDICASENDLAIYNAEMQNLYPNNSVESLQLPFRSRAYQSMIDVDALDKGAKYKDLPDVNIVFICTFDPFGLGRYLYLFENTCADDQNLKLNDRARRFFFNATSNDPDIPVDIKQLFDYIMSQKAENGLTKRINNAVERVKHNSEERSLYNHMFFPDDIIDEAKAEAAWEKLVSLIEDALRRGKTRDEIAEFLNISLDTIKEAEKYMNND